ncbi:hypothetical protein [Halobacillus mangrovi]|uniref:hypothetical protein n=1 Tax=Halobacillus mangrovi TaxID=402384 RepID=UPI003D99485F
MKEILVDYGTREIQWGWIILSIVILLAGIGLSISISKGALKLQKNKLDALRYASWGLVLAGGIVGVLSLLNSELNNNQKNSAMNNWKSERGYYVENYGKIAELRNETIRVETINGEMVEKDIDKVISGCDFEVYAELTNGDVWVCTP